MLPSTRYNAALEDFQRARRQAAAQAILRRLRGQPVALLPFEEIYQHLPTQGSHERGLEEIPLDAIVGSMGRYAEFSRDFLPRSAALQNRWARVKSAFRNLEEMPPIKVYKVGEVYFVLDGNHRVSVARQHGAKTIRAYVTELKTSVPITPESDLEEIIIAAERQKFLERTHLDRHYPALELEISSPGKYRVLEHQIEALCRDAGDLTFRQAARRWYEEIYLPVVELIAVHNLLRDFPGRTPADLYVWITQHQQELESALGWAIAPEDAARDLADHHSSRPQKVMARWRERLLETLRPRSMEPGPKPGEWRRQVASLHRERLFERILVALSGTPESWQALDEALLMAQREEGLLLGLHVVATQRGKGSPAVQMLETEFRERCQRAGVQAEFAVVAGKVAGVIVERSRWSDLVVVHLADPPEEGMLRQLAPGFHRLIRRCPRPLLAVPCAASDLHTLLLAYDGSPKADEALFLAAYLAARWRLPLTTLVVVTSESFPHRAIVRAREYLSQRRIPGNLLIRYGDVAEMVMQTAETMDADLLLMGGYSQPPMLDVVVGSAVNQVLRCARRPVLICR